MSDEVIDPETNSMKSYEDTSASGTKSPLHDTQNVFMVIHDVAPKLKLASNVVRKKKFKFQKVQSPPKFAKKKSQKITKSKFTCNFCSAGFTSAVSLGGHVSKAHPGSSTNYSRKLEIRKQRSKDRESLASAKVWVAANLEMDPKENRALVTKVKNMLMTGKNLCRESLIPRKLRGVRK